MLFGNDPFAISSGGGGAVAIASHDYGADPQTSVILNDIFEAGKSYHVKGRGLSRDSGTGTFASLAVDLVKTDDTSGGSFKFLRYRWQSTSTAVQQSALSNRAAIETGLNFEANGAPVDFDLYIYRPNNNGEMYYKFEFITYTNTTTVIVDQGFSFGGLNAIADTLITGIKFPSGGNSPINAGTIEVFEL